MKGGLWLSSRFKSNRALSVSRPRVHLPYAQSHTQLYSRYAESLAKSTDFDSNQTFTPNTIANLLSIFDSYFFWEPSVSINICIYTWSALWSVKKCARTVLNQRFCATRHIVAYLNATREICFRAYRATQQSRFVDHKQFVTHLLVFKLIKKHSLRCCIHWFGHQLNTKYVRNSICWFGCQTAVRLCD